MHDAADKANEDEARAWELFEAKQLERQINERAIRARFQPVTMHCLQCGDEVPLERQRAMPQTRRCVRCATSLER